MTEPPTVLIIEDSSTQAKLIAAQLSQYNVNVIWAEDGLQGLRMLEVEHPALVVLDINMPRMDGYQVCRRLKHPGHHADVQRQFGRCHQGTGSGGRRLHPERPVRLPAPARDPGSHGVGVR